MDKVHALGGCAAMSSRASSEYLQLVQKQWVMSRLVMFSCSSALFLFPILQELLQ
jgi:hypothetical protein